jgi:preprotein translocase subunit SecG
MVDKKSDRSQVGYLLGILSIVLAFFTPLAALILGIVGFNISKKQKTDLGTKGKGLSKIGIILSVIFLLIYISLGIFVGINEALGNFPLA